MERQRQATSLTFRRDVAGAQYVLNGVGARSVDVDAPAVRQYRNRDCEISQWYFTGAVDASAEVTKSCTLAWALGDCFKWPSVLLLRMHLHADQPIADRPDLIESKSADAPRLIPMPALLERPQRCFYTTAGLGIGPRKFLGPNFRHLKSYKNFESGFLMQFEMRFPAGLVAKLVSLLYLFFLVSHTNRYF